MTVAFNISAGSMFWSVWGLAGQSFITVVYLHSMGSVTYDSDSVPETEWLIFTWLFYGTPCDSAWTRVNIHSLQARQKHSLHSTHGQQQHKFIKIKSSLTLDFTIGHWLFSLVCPGLHTITYIHSTAPRNSVTAESAPILNTVNGMQETVVGNSFPAVTRMISNPSPNIT